MAALAIGMSGLGARYATALFELAEESKALDAVAGDLQRIKALLNESADMRRLVRSPVISREDQGNAILAVLDKLGVSPLARKFIGLVAANRRLFAIDVMIDAFLSELARRRGEMTASVRSAHALTPAQTNALTDHLRKTFGQRVTVDVSVDPSLLGGMIVRVGSRMVDSSLKTKLDRMQLAMKGIV